MTTPKDGSPQGIARGDETFRVAVYISGTALQSDNEALPRKVVAATAIDGGSVVATLLALDEPPQRWKRAGCQDASL